MSKIEEIWEKHKFRIDLSELSSNGSGAVKYKIDVIELKDFKQAAAELCQLQREMCYDAFFDYNESNKMLMRVGNMNDVRDVILNAKLEAGND